MDERFRVFVDARIPFGEEVFSLLGPVTTFDGLEVRHDPSPLVGAQVLITRSVTPIGSFLLGALPHLVALASPTIGTDHVDFPALEEHRRRTGRPIPFFHAPGATSGGVADFTLAAILLAAQDAGTEPTSWRVGIWGCGNCGSALAARLDRLGISWVAHDPPRAERDGFPSASIEAILDCDVVTLHVPLTHPAQSRWPTHHLVAGSLLERLIRQDRVLINTSRGSVVDTVALTRTLSVYPRTRVCLDVWEGEPTPDPALVRACFLATPHSAGSIIEGRLRSVGVIYRSLRTFLAPWAPPAPSCLDARSPVGPFRFPDERDAFLEAVGISRLDHDFRREYLVAPPERRGAIFDRMRVERTRHEVNWDNLVPQTSVLDARGPR